MFVHHKVALLNVRRRQTPFEGFVVCLLKNLLSAKSSRTIKLRPGAALMKSYKLELRPGLIRLRFMADSK